MSESSFPIHVPKSWAWERLTAVLIVTVTYALWSYTRIEALLEAKQNHEVSIAELKTENEKIKTTLEERIRKLEDKMNEQAVTIQLLKDRVAH